MYKSALRKKKPLYKNYFTIKSLKKSFPPFLVTSTDVCKLPPVSGECISQPYVNRTYFNKDTRQCETFMYREGCEGNDNNFLTLEACIRGCTNGN